MADSLKRLLAQLEEARHRFGSQNAVCTLKLLRQLAKRRFSDAASLLRFHDALLFLRAFPADAAIVQETEALLSGIGDRVALLREDGADLSALDEESFSGISGGDVVDTFSFEIARWLAKKFPGEVSIYWENWDKDPRLGNTWPRFLPLLEEDAFVEPDVSYRRWLESARGKQAELPWLLRRFEELPPSERERAELYESLELPIRWNLENSAASRTLSRGPARKMFYHREPLLQRRDVSIAEELSKPPLPLRSLPPGEGAEMLRLACEALTVRYRGLHGMTYGTGMELVEADFGRGMQMYFWGVAPEWRLPLRAYCAGFGVKNGVPINYIEAIALCDWMEIGFNTFYAFRDGEAAWIYSQALRVFQQLLGANCISVYPYQIGQDNEEAIKSGAFWFYRKLGFRPGRPDLRAITEKEEAKIAENRSYRTPARTLRKLAEGHVFYETPNAEKGAWDRFHMRTLGYAVQRHMARKFDGDAAAMLAASVASLEQALGVNVSRWNRNEQRAFQDFAVIAALLDVRTWAAADRKGLAEIIRAKMGKDEWRYLALLRAHPKLRTETLRLGSEV